MTQIVRKQFSTNLSVSFLNSIQQQRDKFYYFLGKVEPWENLVDEPSPGAQILSEDEDVRIRNNIVYIKKITPNDVSLVARRYNWTSNTVYAQWDHTVDMDGQQFFVYTEDGNVYKCLHNNYGAASTVKPEGKNLQPFYTSDLYLWKYMYTVPGFKRARFISYEYIPVQKSLSDNFYSNGAVELVTILNGGSGYSSTAQTYITVSGTTTGSGASASFTIDSFGRIQSITGLIGGSNYTSGVKISVISSVGENAVLTPVIVGGVITSIIIENPGYGYQATDTITFTVGGAIILPKLNSLGSLDGVIIVDPGIGYSSAPTLNVLSTVPGAPIDGLYAGNSGAILEAVIDEGKVQRVLIRDPGVGYPLNTSTIILSSGDGVGFSATPVVFNGEIVDVVINNPGYGYTSLNLQVSGDGTGANLNPVLLTNDFNSEQSVVEQVAVDGAIYAIVVTEEGTGYTETTQVNIVGDGVGATATATIVNNTVSKITVTNWGSGYTYANVVITDVNRLALGPGLLVDATAYAILPPGLGHGSDAVKELYARTFVLSTQLRYEPVIKNFNQEYRQFGIVTNPRNITTNKLATVDYDINVFVCTFNTVTGLLEDEILILDSKYKFRVVAIDGTTVWLQPIYRKFNTPAGTLVSEIDTFRSYTCLSNFSAVPLINKYTGNLLYSSNEAPFEFSETQGVLIKTYITF